MATASWATSSAGVGASNNSYEMQDMGRGLSNALQSLGFVWSPGTFQQDWITTPFVYTGGTNIWQFSGPLQSTYPLFLYTQFRIDPFSNMGALNIAIIRAHDAAGNVTSGFLGTETLYINPNGFVSSAVHYAAGNPAQGWVWIGLNLQVSIVSGTVLAVFDRSRDASGAATPDGGFLFVSSESRDIDVPQSFLITRRLTDANNQTTQNYRGGPNVGPWAIAIPGLTNVYPTNQFNMSPDGLSPVVVPVVGGCRNVPPWSSSVMLIPMAGGDSKIVPIFKATVDGTGEHIYRNFGAAGKRRPLNNISDNWVNDLASVQSYCPALRWD